MRNKLYGLGSFSQPNGPENHVRRSSRISSGAGRCPSSSRPPQDSRKSTHKPASAQPATQNKRSRNASVSDTDTSDVLSCTKKKKANNKKTNVKSSQQNNSNQGSVIDLREDSDEENLKITLTKKPKDKKYDSVLDFFGEPFYPEKASVRPHFTFFS